MKFLVLGVPKFKKQTKEEIKNLFPNSHFQDLYEGNLILNISIPKNKVLKKVKNKLTWTHNIIPIDLHYKNVTNFKEIANQIINKKLLNKKLSFKIETLSYKANIKTRDFEVQVGTYLEKNKYKFKKENFKQLISAILYKNEIYIGISKTSDLIYKHLSLTKLYKKNKSKINRSELKLKEAFEKFKINIRGNSNYAIDLGASPGGWTKFLKEKGFKVISIDKGDLDTSLRIPEIIQIKERIMQKNLKEIKERINKILKRKKAKILTNDMNINPEESSQIMNYFSRFINKNAIGIITLKYTKRNPKIITNSKEILNQKYKIISIKHLEQNRKELTLYLKRK
jgi:23S rRNA (cytidine2498-2'-O)-methyltransferase